MLKLCKWGAFLLFFTFACAAVYAQDSMLEVDDEVTLIITAERTPQPVSESISSATVVTAKEIKEKGAQTVADALRNVPGVSIAQNGELGSLANAKLRGVSSAQALVLIDGKRLTSSAFGSNTDLSKIPTDNISRIEVIRGPVSSLYGSDAIGGVINIITKKPTANAGDATLGFGSNGRAARSIAVRGIAKNSNYSFSASFPKYNGSRPNSEFSATDLSGSIEFPDVKGWALSLSGNTYHDSLGLPGSITFPSLVNHQWWKRNGIEFSAKRDINDGEFEIRRYKIKQLLTELSPDWFTDSLITGNTNALEMTYSKDFGINNLILGAEFRSEKYEDIEHNVVVQDKKITNKAFFVQDRLPIGENTDLVAGIRFDDHSTAGNRITPRLGLSYELNSNSRLRASYSEGFRAPSLVELYYNNFGSVGNPNLKPEKSRQYEVGINTKYGMDTFDFALFKGKIKDQIAFIIVDPIFFAGTFENLERTKQNGFEFNWTRAIDDTTDINLSYTYTDALNLANDSRIGGIPYNKAGITLTKQLNNVNLALTGKYVGNRMYGMVKSPSYTVFDFYASLKANNNITPYLMIRNITDKKYDEVAGYPAEERSFELGVKSSW